MALLTALEAEATPITTLNPMVVTATRAAQPLEDVAASVTVITAEEIAARGATRLEEVLRDVAGVHIVSQGPAGSLATANIRGSESAQVLVLLDGIRLNSAQDGLFNLANLPVSLKEIERIEVVRGPVSALYGSNALGGVIQIFTRAPLDRPVTQLHWSEGRFETRTLGFSTSQRKDGVRYRLGAGLDRSQGFRENSDLDQTTLGAMVGFDLGGGFDLELSAHHLDKEAGVPGSLTFPSPEARQSDVNTLTALTLSGPVGGTEFSARGFFERRRIEFLDPGAFFPAADTHVVETLGAELQGRRGLGRHTLMGGIDFFQDDLVSTAVGDHDQERWAVFSQLELKATDRATFLVGVRYDDHSDFRNEWSPRGALLLALSDGTRLRASAGKAFRAPTLNDRFWDSDFARGNPALRPETGWEYEIGAQQRLSRWGTLSLSGFRRDVRDLIDWRPIDPNDIFSPWNPVNVNNARIWGAEAELRLVLHPLLAVGGNHAWLRPKDRADGEYIGGKVRHQSHLFLDVGPLAEMRLRLDGRYTRHYSQPARENNSYVVVDAALTRPFALGAVELDARVSVRNLFDREYQVNPGYPMPPRQLHAGITAWF